MDPEISAVSRSWELTTRFKHMDLIPCKFEGS
jgi:hypothetical protein